MSGWVPTKSLIWDNFLKYATNKNDAFSYLEYKYANIIPLKQLDYDHASIGWGDGVEHSQGIKYGGHSGVVTRVHEHLPVGRGQGLVNNRLKMLDHFLDKWTSF